ncbi:BLUF domain-containing protein [Sphingomonas sp. JC676]|uniref:BLUF domain-containing protein n=1 Tax=Sphingomonas sp. JC676 TaxID=2768065 RepID=UPI0016577815|nr:BLUF domain-containing protein [Sphingomonas sp. JC676]MBC9033840.1 BLUF domain-containing protein [Sphingomonas sp. JC676]
MRQIVYISTAAGDVGPAALTGILAASRANNRRDGITGLLYSDGKRFLQAIEGEEPDLTRTLDRIRADCRHRAIVILSNRAIEAREFGSWEMAERRPGVEAQAFLTQVSTLVAGASANVRATFEGLANVRTAA